MLPRFIVDAQLPQPLSDLLVALGYDSVNTLDLPNKNTTTYNIISYLANKEDRIVITKDADFLESFIVKNEPAKLILVKTGNIRNIDLLKIFSINLGYIVEVFQNCNYVELTKDEIIVHK